MKAGYQPCSILMELLIPLSFSPYRSKHSLRSHVRYALVTRGYTQNCKTIFNGTLSKIQLAFDHIFSVSLLQDSSQLTRNGKTECIRRIGILRVASKKPVDYVCDS